MLLRNRVYFALTLVTTVAMGCGSDGDTTGTGGSAQAATTSTDASSGSGGSGGSGGAGGSGASCPSNEGTVLAVRQLIFGQGNSGEWKKIGFDLDGKASDELSTDVCQPNAGGDPMVAYPDGDGGIDNSFGKNLLPRILSLYPTWVQDVGAGIQNGTFTALLKVMCLPPTGDAPVLTTKLFGGTTLGMTPKWDGTDTWPVEPGLLSDPMDPESSSLIFPTSSVMGMAYDAGKNGTFLLSVPFKTTTNSASIKLTLYAAQMKMTLSADRKSATAGMIGGVLNTEEFVAEVKKVGALFNFCGNPLFDGLVTQTRQASDIMADGTQDPSQTCDGISMGLGFEMQEAQLGGVGPANPVGMACP